MGKMKFVIFSGFAVICAGIFTMTFVSAKEQESRDGYVTETIQKILDSTEDSNIGGELMVSIYFKDTPEVKQLLDDYEELWMLNTDEEYAEAGIVWPSDGSPLVMTEEVIEKEKAWKEKGEPKRKEISEKIRLLRGQIAQSAYSTTFQQFFPLDEEKGEHVIQWKGYGSGFFGRGGLELSLTQEEIRWIYQCEEVAYMMAEVDDGFLTVDYTYIGSDEGNEEQNRDTGAC